MLVLEVGYGQKEDSKAAYTLIAKPKLSKASKLSKR